MPDPVAFSCYLAPARTVLAADQDEARLTLTLSAADAAHVLSQWSRLAGQLLHCALVPAGEVARPAPGDLRRGGWGRKPRKGQRDRLNNGAVD